MTVIRKVSRNLNEATDKPVFCASRGVCHHTDRLSSRPHLRISSKSAMHFEKAWISDFGGSTESMMASAPRSIPAYLSRVPPPAIATTWPRRTVCSSATLASHPAVALEGRYAVNERRSGCASSASACSNLRIIVGKQRYVAYAREIAGEIGRYRSFFRTSLRVQDENALHVDQAYAVRRGVPYKGVTSLHGAWSRRSSTRFHGWVLQLVR